MPYETVALDDVAKEIEIIDQTKLPGEIRLLRLSSIEEFYTAIYLLQVRGAPAIGVFAAFAIYLCACGIKAVDYDGFIAEFDKCKDYLNSSRPTAVNLSWALNRMRDVAQQHSKEPVSSIIDALKEEALLIRREDEDACRAIGENALTLLKPGYGLLTHCNAGSLATSKYGTATAAMYLGNERGYGFHIYCDETRPLLQGARLTAFELANAGMERFHFANFRRRRCHAERSVFFKRNPVEDIRIFAEDILTMGHHPLHLMQQGVARHFLITVDNGIAIEYKVVIGCDTPELDVVATGTSPVAEQCIFGFRFCDCVFGDVVDVIAFAGI